MFPMLPVTNIFRGSDELDSSHEFALIPAKTAEFLWGTLIAELRSAMPLIVA